jgi:hypothetical protein
MNERAIWKFTLDPLRTSVRMPQGARLLHAHEQHGEVCVWAECDPSAPVVARRIQAVTTGGRVTVRTGDVSWDPNGCEYVGTVHVGSLVFHIYDGGET